ncbi:MAG: 50S ribosomal protein L11 methyltransferase [Clostridiales bacterium]|jgi:ribosomal protein L11 methyltransferase|nr:50S ribosomal protein L11 methyltransferase [Clostridiales bacterium]
MDWFQGTITARPEAEEILLGFLLSRGFDQVEIENPGRFWASLQENSAAWDYLAGGLNDPADFLRLRFFLSPDHPQLQAKQLAEDLAVLPGECPQINWKNMEISFEKVDDQNWLNAWRQFYRPIPVGERLLIQPGWLPQEPTERMVLRLEPGLAFGSGDHASTRLCLLALEKYLPPAARLADIGTGSGILAIAGVLLGAAEVVAVDNDSTALAVARQNCLDNDCAAEVRLLSGNLAEPLAGSFDFICANIVADPIMQLIPALNRYLLPGGYFLASGIIRERRDEVLAVLAAYDFTLVEEMSEGSWLALVVRL